MDNTEGSKTIRSFQDHMRYLSPTAVIHTPGNFELSYKTSYHAYMSYMLTEYKHALLLRTLNSRDIANMRESDIPNINKKNWDNRVEIMYRVTLNKFMSNEKFAYLLLHRDSQYDTFIYENKYHDNFWGDCICGNRSECDNAGINHLGILLCTVKQEIQTELANLPTVEAIFPRIHEMSEFRKKRYQENEGNNIYLVNND